MLVCKICKKKLKDKKVIKVDDKEHEICGHHPVPDDIKKEVE